MMYITARQTAEKWQVSVRTVQHLCKEGRIEGAMRWGRTWMIPENAERLSAENKIMESVQGDIKCPDAGVYMQKKNPVMMITYRYKEPDDMSAVSEKTAVAVLSKAWLSYTHGEIDEAISLLTPLLSMPADFYGTISIGLLQAACAIWKGDTQLWFDGRRRIKSVPCRTAADLAAQKFWLATVDEGLLDNSHFPDWFRKGRLDVLPQDSKPSLVHHYARYLYLSAKNIAVGKSSVPEISGLGAMRLLPHLLEPMIAEAKAGKFSFLEISLRLLCAATYHDLGEARDAVIHLDAALHLALSGRLYGALAEFRGLFDHLMDDRLSLLDAEAARHVRNLQKEMMQGFAVMSRTLKHVPIITTLSPREQEIAKLAALGLSNMEIADRLQISLSSVKTMITRIMNKTGTEKRTEFFAFIP